MLPSMRNSYVTSTKSQPPTTPLSPTTMGSTSLHRTIILSLLYLLIICVQISLQHCPKGCSCDEQEIEYTCKSPLGVSALPHTLNPSTLRIFINHAQTSHLSGLDYLEKLEILDLAYNKLSVVDFAEMTKNVNLNLFNASRNEIVDIKDASITAITNNLSLMNLAPESDIFDARLVKLVKSSPINLVELVLNHNHLTTLRNLTFIRFHRLQRLDLSYNSISWLEGYSLFGLSKLETINLRGNRLMQIPSAALHSTARTLQLQTTASFWATKTAPLKLIDLSENEFTSIGPDSFISLERAQEIYLEHCSLETIHERAFKGLHTLYLLSLDGNRLQKVPSSSFAHLGLLRVLRMNANSLMSISAGAFASLVNLEDLQMNNATFSELQRGTFVGLDSLRRLEIAYNPNLTAISKGTFDNMSRLTYLNLYYDAISSIPDDLAYITKSLQILDLRGNSLSCGCDLKWLTKWLKHFNHSTHALQHESSMSKPTNFHGDAAEEARSLLSDHLFTSELLNISCSHPPALAGKPIIGLPDNKLECIEPSSDLNVHIGFAALFFVMFMMTLVCTVNFCRNKKHLLIVLKENLAHSNISVMLPYSQNLHKNVDDLKRETELYDTEFESMGTTNQTRMRDFQGEQLMHHQQHQYSQYI